MFGPKYQYHLGILLLLFLANFALAWCLVKIIITLRSVLHERELKRFQDSLADFTLDDETSSSHWQV
jgi:uncharacterized membrane protein YciS (DUF1049 family)